MEERIAMAKVCRCALQRTLNVTFMLGNTGAACQLLVFSDGGENL